MKYIILLLFLTINTSFMKDTETFVVCLKENPDMAVMCFSTHGDIMFTNNDPVAMHFTRTRDAQNFIGSLSEPPSLFGIRPIKKPK